jgi:hypothetical protein
MSPASAFVLCDVRLFRVLAGDYFFFKTNHQEIP